MKISLICVGRLGNAPEARLALDWAARAQAAGRALALAPVEIVEIEARKGLAEAILERARGASLIACDESGQGLTSRALAGLIARERDEGARHLAFVIGGADGLEPQVLAAAGRLLAFGPQTWPHALARAMLAEQIYRATTILSGSPYHRD